MGVGTRETMRLEKRPTKLVVEADHLIQKF